ncbi:hypothetical protein [Oscillatoria sp. HE19RPO]|uniref:hypothetical protein n=1 Tax=Oscillatoria sp. HE19RPO TaxID=2954806 RepID=UPI0020C43D6C|nr:hypothetical protein [Oscillatoria sp. HE19RPO]
MTKYPESQHHKLSSRIFADNQDLDLIKWLENDANSDLVIQAEKIYHDRQEEQKPQTIVNIFGKKITNLINQWIKNLEVDDVQKITGWFSSHFLAQAEDLHGDVFVSDELQKDSKITATVVSGATWINAMTNWPILYYAFNNWGTLVALTSTIILDFLLLTWTNNTGTAAAGGNKGKWWWSWAGVMAFLLISTLQSIVAGVGAELINNQDELSQIKAGEIIDSYFAQLAANLAERNTLYEEYKKKCDRDTEILKTMPYWDPTRNSLYLDTKGKYGEEDKDWSNTPQDNIPTCPRSSLLGEVVNEQRNELEAAKNNRQKLGNLGYLKEELKERYSQSFTEEGRLKSGTIAVELAVNNFWQKFSNWELEKLGFSLFFLALSVITSLGALLMTLTYAIKYSTKMSRNTRVERTIRIWLHEVWCSYMDRVARDQQNNFSELKPYHGILLCLFIQEVQKTGRCNYPVLQQIAEAAQQYPDYLLMLDQYRQLLTELEQSYDNICQAVIALNCQLSKISNKINTGQSQAYNIYDSEESDWSKNLHRLSDGIHTLVKVSKKSYSVKSIKLIGFPIGAILERRQDNYFVELTDKIHQDWKKLNQQCNLTWVLYGSEENSLIAQNHSLAGSDTKKRCCHVKQQLSELPGYCIKLYVETKDRIKDKIDEARLTPLDTFTPELPSGLDESK